MPASQPISDLRLPPIERRLSGMPVVELKDRHWGAQRIARPAAGGTAANDPVADVARVLQLAPMGKRSGVPHTDDELDNLTVGELRAELDRSRTRLSIAPSAKMAQQWKKRIHRIEAAIERRA